ncbi:similar to Saccharomyces cerevisiae YKL154W SRP102 Signal recognition particle (SRP) receptor beta subunit [Maudiozyma barnettii]|uniref:Signal recognition particle receptor subunit beta n=1 Tax=Maudiozyma barnettii TaxID=61262 RepID=A0A8H2VGR5_9SACH|nr:Signal recognition particle receptor subunit beta [Kazachstania barnettii]CAB4254938.1 similar to Saccharomyces cerevisiae YKL154W SRP102 Signal recognition particle (SRP) receptor beta subunit [Kazachstania barnettii]CAD1783209.1 similar to Saccharomyces cerevisiae YKL154W SRP102 Signal recognition particle (SRP) receptor beta subunit [Kazachstania barnettii]
MVIDTNTVSIALACFLILLTTVVYFVFTAKKSATTTKTKEPAVFITGPSKSGKTALFTLLTTGEVRNTVTSQDINLKKNYESRVNLIDFPGHVKLHYKLMDALRETEHIKGILFVVDATTDPKKLSETAEFLLDILSITEVSKEPIDILIACNKSESFTARPPAKIIEALEKEVGLTIERHNKSLGEVRKRADFNTGGDDSDDENAGFLENVNGNNKFTFSMLEGEVEALKGSVSKKDISNWEEWLDGKVSA